MCPYYILIYISAIFTRFYHLNRRFTKIERPGLKVCAIKPLKAGLKVAWWLKGDLKALKGGLKLTYRLLKGGH